MGSQAPKSGLAGSLFTPVQQRVLGLLFGQPDRQFQSAELIRLARSGTGAVHRQLERLAQGGLVTVTRLGNQKYYQANREAPIFQELHGLIAKTVGVAGPLRNALIKLSPRIRAAFVYGSLAKGREKSGSDIDLMVVSDTLRYPQLYEALQPMEHQLGRSVNPTVMTWSDWQSKRRRKDSFVTGIAEQPRLFIIGTPDDLP